MEKNGFYRNFLWAVYWALLIGSFGYTTFVGWSVQSAFADHCKDQKNDLAVINNDLRRELISIHSALAAINEKLGRA